MEAYLADCTISRHYALTCRVSILNTFAGGGRCGWICKLTLSDCVAGAAMMSVSIFSLCTRSSPTAHSYGRIEGGRTTARSSVQDRRVGGKDVGGVGVDEVVRDLCGAGVCACAACACADACAVLVLGLTCSS
jgi:hypothetical protein